MGCPVASDCPCLDVAYTPDNWCDGAQTPLGLQMAKPVAQSNIVADAIPIAKKEDIPIVAEPVTE